MIGFVKRSTVRPRRTTEQLCDFISSLSLSMETFARACRSHWRFQKSCHWVLDLTSREDESRTREKSANGKSAQGNIAQMKIAWLYRFRLSFFKQHPSQQHQAMKRRSCGSRIEFLAEVGKWIEAS